VGSPRSGAYDVILRELHGVPLSQRERRKFRTADDALQNLGGYRGSFVVSRHLVCLCNGVRTMFKFVGWVVVTGFGLYGLVKFVKEHVVSEVHEAPRATG